MAKSPPEKDNIELQPDAWERFERAVGLVAKSPPQHRVRENSKARRTKGLSQKKARPKRIKS